MYATMDSTEFAQATLVLRDSMNKLSPNARRTIRQNVDNDEWLDCRHFGIGQWVRGCLQKNSRISPDELEDVWKDVLKSAVSA